MPGPLALELNEDNRFSISGESGAIVIGGRYVLLFPVPAAEAKAGVPEEDVKEDEGWLEKAEDKEMVGVRSNANDEGV